MNKLLKTLSITLIFKSLSLAEYRYFKVNMKTITNGIKLHILTESYIVS